MHEMLHRRIWHLGSDELRSKVKLIVLGQEQRAAREQASCRERSPGHSLVDHAVAVPPGLVKTLVNDRLHGDVQQIVVGKPEQRIADDSVVKLVRSSDGRSQKDWKAPVTDSVRTEASARPGE